MNFSEAELAKAKNKARLRRGMFILPSLFTAMQEQLGLKLESQKGPVDTIVIDHIEKPSEN